jgi:H+/gluconate symporter-like permease
VTRVGEAFGSTAGAITIVIACAAVIGKAMMDSGAADQVVRTALKLFGEKRAPAAMMMSGFVLSIPVFFDTVFYLLVPLARSLYRSTRKNFLLYVLAIGSGSLCASWMNDSGFWIFSKMSGLTEVEALKTWTPALIVLSVVGLLITILLAMVLPMASAA